MLFKKSLGRRSTQSNFGIRLFMVLPILLLLTSCTTTYIPGLDRILFSDSSAKVGPLVPADKQYPVDDADAVTATSIEGSMIDPVSELPELTGETKAGLETELEPTIQGIDLKTASSEENHAEALGKKVESYELKSPEIVASETTAKKANREVTMDYGAVAGKVVFIGDKGRLLPATGTLVTLTPKTLINEVQNRPSKVHIIDMEDKEYQPRYSTINAGDQVVFVNKDNIRHNVFSSSGSNAFDLGTYGAGLKRAVTLKEPGVVKIYCNIHSEMATFIAVGSPGLSVKADDQGGYQINEVIPGTYELTIWNIRGETKQTVEVKANETVNLVDRVNTIALNIESHKNKFGSDYSKNSTLFEDEFY